MQWVYFQVQNDSYLLELGEFNRSWNPSVKNSVWIFVSERLGPPWCICIITDVRAVVLNKKASRLSQIWEQDHRHSCNQLWQSDYNNQAQNQAEIWHLNWWTEIYSTLDSSSSCKTRKCVLALPDLSLNCFLVNCLWSKHLRFCCYPRCSSTTGLCQLLVLQGACKSLRCLCLQVATLHRGWA